ncbi:chondroitinase family polysaccharide lyase [Paludibacter sp.]
MFSQKFDFDSGVVTPFQTVEPSGTVLSLVSAPFKDGSHALEWVWTAQSTLLIDYSVNLKNFRDGVIFWVYNDKPGNAPLVCEFRDVNNNVRYYFNFGLNFKGWRICRIGSKYMLGNKGVSSNLKLYIKSPEGVSSGKLYIDRFSYVADVNYQNAPDAQQPNNNEAANMIHWNSLWKWESELTYDLPLPGSLSSFQKNSLQKIEQGIYNRLPKAANTSAVNAATNLFTKAKIKKEGDFWIGSPLVVKPDKTASDITLVDLGTMMFGFALDAKFNNNDSSRQKYIDLWEYALSQGFAYGSSMGNNHHYGYETRQIFQAAFLMKDVLISSGKISDVAAALSYWSGLPESRRAFVKTREGVVDTWNTLLFPRLISAMLIQDLPQRYRALQSLVRWVDTSLEYTPGNMGGLKPDGTIFHHAGHYPAYGVGGFAGLGDFIAVLPETEFNLSQTARKNLADALIAMSNYTNLYDWSIGMSGRHPHDGSLNKSVVETFGLLALLGSAYTTDIGIDALLAGEYLRLESENTELKQQLSAFSANATPTGFFVFNHAAAGVHRFGNSMVTIKGYNSDVWGSEIYTNDNRFGRYQSYGAVEIINEGSPVSRSSSRFNEAGWDWNRLPGTTTIHLPLNLLESPVTSTLMARSKEDFAGASSLMNKYGVFGMKLREENMINNTNYTSDFKARKSVFVFDKRIVCIGTNISNSNGEYPTETTLFQQSIYNQNERISVNNSFSNALGFSYEGNSTSPMLLSDISGNYYRIASNNHIKVDGKEQISQTNTTKIETRGNFVAAVINHGNSPANTGYEYMIMLKPTPPEKNKWSQNPGYKVIQADSVAHIVFDSITNVQSYVCYETTIPPQGLVKQVSAETLLMVYQKDNRNVNVSVCDPSLHLPEKTKNSDNTSKDGVVTYKEIIIEGSWQLKQNSSKIVVDNSSGIQTKITVSSHLGIPVEFELIKNETSVKTNNIADIKVLKNKNRVDVLGYTSSVSIFDISGKEIEKKAYLSEVKSFFLNQGNLYLLFANLPDDSIMTSRFCL